MSKIKYGSLIIGIAVLVGCYHPTLEDAQKAHVNMMRLLQRPKDSGDYDNHIDSVRFYYRIQANYLINEEKKKKY